MNYPANSITIILSRPYSLNGTDITEMTMREPTVRDKILFEKMAGGPQVKEATMLASLCGLSGPEALYNLPCYDYDQLTEAFERFLLPPEERQNPTLSATSPE
jgi:hypothetical protein